MRRSTIVLIFILFFTIVIYLAIEDSSMKTIILPIILILLIIIILSSILNWQINRSYSVYDKKPRKSHFTEFDENMFEEKFDNDEGFKPVSSDAEDFNDIIETIENDFYPNMGVDESDYEKQLLLFLAKKFPNQVKIQGHTTDGKKIDIVIDGTYAIELITVESEGKLVSVIDQITKSKEDFPHFLLILVDVGKVHYSKIEDYIKEYQRIGVKTISK